MSSRFADIVMAVIVGAALHPLAVSATDHGATSAGLVSMPQNVRRVAVRLGVDLIGFDMMPLVVQQPSATEERTPMEVEKGRVYTLDFYFRLLEPVKKTSTEVTLLSGSMPIAQLPIRFDDTQIGAVHKVPVSIRIPLTGPTGEVALRIRPDVLNRTADIGTLLVREREVSIQTSPVGENYQQASGNLIQNGSFEQGTAHWEIYDPWPPGVSVQVDDEVAYDGRASARLDFSGGSNPSVWRILYQSVGAKPSTAYELSYQLKTEHISTPCGVKLEVVDRDQMQRYIVGVDEFLTGTQEWTPMTYQFQTPEFTRGLTVRVRRYRCGVTFGSAWFDRIALTESQ